MEGMTRGSEEVNHWDMKERVDERALLSVAV